ncbi:nitrogen regulation protein NR(I) [Pelagibaculum spongiae]|uniref:DNA-binding transcriptional regulator NtrC n=1 Tax=Pelagibaculum spongiae TaxID=2080658 RepID=A0A2V1GYR3_9GAMM|nr:nitrogen regulation protein NR(I) [Pelagibaculum spongiae]PVZ67662.1 nitrogen regulation protein NR(I) [Pelagibaculum spongiae]
MSQDKVWIIDDDSSIRWVLERAFTKADIAWQSFDNALPALDALEYDMPTAMITDVRMPGLDGMQLMQRVHKRRPDVPVIVMTAHSDLDSAVAAYEGGAFEYLPKPFDMEEAVAVVRRAFQNFHENHQQEVIADDADTPEIVGKAPSMQEVFRAIGRLAKSNITVMINGESGTGKELVARALHRHSPRRDNTFIALNMAAIPKDLIESELFGHEKGAFTGAAGSRQGRFEQSNGGTLFLDEIGDMPLEVQTRLLRVLADGEFYRVGGHTPIKVDVRIIAATHQDLEQRVKEGKFREDLFHRLNVIRVHLPRLADRAEDIPDLINHFLAAAAREMGVEAKVLTSDTEKYMSSLDWPGNVRQLENTCRWLTVMASGREVHVSDLPPELLQVDQETQIDGDWQTGLKRWAETSLAAGKEGLLEEAVPCFEKIMIEAALKHTAGRKRDAAVLLGWGRNTLTRKLKELGLDEYRSDGALEKEEQI